MKKKVMKACMDFVRKYNPEKSETDFEIIQYGLEGFYLMITKIVIILLLSIILGIWKEVIIFLFVYNLIRTPSFGLHATKSWICLVSSTSIFIGIPILCMHITMPFFVKGIIGIISLLFI